jgi:GxxExxY protein
MQEGKMSAGELAFSTAESAEDAENKSVRLNRLTESIIGAAMRVHKALGPGLLESAYEACLAFELIEMGFEVAQQQPMPVVYRGVRLSCGYRTDLIVERDVIVEVKSVSRIEPIHEAQVISYLKLSNRQLGLLINFNGKLLKNGIRRFVNGFPGVSAPSALSAVHSGSPTRGEQQ